MKIKIQFKINDNTQKFNMFLTIYDIIIQIKSYIFIFLYVYQQLWPGTCLD